VRETMTVRTCHDTTHNRSHLRTCPLSRDHAKQTLHIQWPSPLPYTVEEDVTFPQQDGIVCDNRDNNVWIVWKKSRLWVFNPMFCWVQIQASYFYQFI